MKKATLIGMNTFLIMVALLSFACKGQTPSTTATSEKSSIGRVVQKLDHRIWQVFEDKSGNYWFGSDSAGVFKFDGKSITQYTIEDGLSSNQIRQIQEDKLGNMFFSTMGGINMFDGNTFSKLEPVVSTEWKLGKDDLWFQVLGNTKLNGPFRYDGKTLYNLQFPSHPRNEERIKQGVNPFFGPYEVYSVYKDRKGHMWFGTSVLGACRFDGEKIEWMYEEDLTIVPAGGSFGIRSVFEDSRGDYWICNSQQRFQFEQSNNPNSIDLKYTKTPGFGNKEIFKGEDRIYYQSVVEDKNGHLWFCNWTNGVYKYDGKNTINYKVEHEGKSAQIVSMYLNSKGTIWLGTNNAGAFRFVDGQFVPFEN
jgi:ligand-binding sensor domain-containing protein